MNALDSLIESLAGGNAPVTPQELETARARLSMRLTAEKDAADQARAGAPPEMVERIRTGPSDPPIQPTMSPIDFMPAPRLGNMAANAIGRLSRPGLRTAAPAPSILPPLPMKPGMGPLSPGAAIPEAELAAMRKAQEEAADAAWRSAMKPEGGPPLLPSDLPPLPPPGPALGRSTVPGRGRR